MSRNTLSLLGFNRGIISRLGLARLDLKDRTFLSAAKQTNWIPRVMGSMMLRPGWQYGGATRSNNKAFHIPFVFSSANTALLEMTDSFMRVRRPTSSDISTDLTGIAPLITRPSVTTAITNGAFTSNLTGWTDADEAGASSVWSAGFMSLTGTGYNKAIRYQTLTVGANANIQHALNIVVTRGPVKIRIGSTVGGVEYMEETLKTGYHSLAFTPTGNFTIQLENIAKYVTLIDSVAIASAGTMEIPTLWVAAKLPLLRYDQSADVVFVACDGMQTRRIERRGDGTSWSIVLYEPDDGPFRLDNTTTTTITPSAQTGDITLQASADIFSSDRVGALYRITSNGQRTFDTFNAENQFSANTIRVTGVGDSRAIIITRSSISGTGTTLTLQRSLDEVTWEDVTTYTTNGVAVYNDGLDNQIWFYRIGVKTGDYSSGTIGAVMSYTSGATVGVVRITGYTDANTVTARVLSTLGGITATSIWAEGRWSDYRGWPSVVRLFQSRLWLAGKQYIWGSISDAFESHDDTVEGDRGPIQRSIGSGPLDNINWIIALSRLFLGTDGAEWQVKSSSLDEPLTPTAFGMVSQGTQGSNAVDCAKMDSSGFFVQAGGERIYAISYKYTGLTDDYGSEDVTRYVPEIGRTGFLRLMLQRQPDTRLHAVCGDGTAAILILEKNENVLCWVDVETDGFIEDVVVLPGNGSGKTSLTGTGSTETEVYFTVRRNINGSDVRYLERWAQEAECSGGSFRWDGVAITDVDLSRNGDPIFPDGTLVTARDFTGTKISNHTVSGGGITLGTPTAQFVITPSLYRLADACIVRSGVAGTASTITGLSHLEGEDVVVWADGKDFSPGRGDDQTTYTVTAGQITLPEAVQHYTIGLPYRARYRSGKLGYVSDGGIALTNTRRICTLGLNLADTHIFGLHYGTDFDNLDDLPLEAPEGHQVEADYVFPDYDDMPFSLDSQWESDSRLCLEANAPRPATVMAAILVTEVSA